MANTNTYRNIVIILFLLGFSSLLFGKHNIKEEVRLKREWDDFRERDDSVFRFNFAVSDMFFSKNYKGNIIGGGIAAASNYNDLSGYAKYAVLKLTEEALSQYSEQNIIVVDSELAAKKPGGKIPGTNNNLFQKAGFL